MGGITTGIGAGAAIEAFLVIKGMSMRVFGISQVAIGLAADPTAENKQLASELHQSITDIGGIVADKAAGNENGEIRSTVQFGSLITGIAAGNTIDLPKSLNSSSIFISVSQLSLWVGDKNTNSNHRETQTTVSQQEPIENDTQDKSIKNVNY